MAAIADRPKVRLQVLGFCLPLMLFTVVFVAYPLYSAIQRSLFGSGVLGRAGRFVWFGNYLSVLGDPAFLASAWFTIRYSLIAVAVEMILGTVMALLMDRSFIGKRVVFSFALVPLMIAPALLAVMFRLLLDNSLGLVPAIASLLGWNVSMADPSGAFILLIILDTVEWSPFVFVIIYAGLHAFPPAIAEAAAIDGASGWQVFVKVKLPILLPVFIAALFLRSIEALRTFDLIYVLTGGGPGTSTTSISIYIYKRAFASQDFGGASAASVILMLVFLPLIPYVVRRLTSNA